MMTHDHPYLKLRPALSIVIPSFHTEKHLVRAVDSVLAQDFSDVEIILVGNECEDSSGKFADSFRDKDPRIKIHPWKNGNRSLPAVWSFGLEKANGVYIYFYNSEDYLLPGAFNHLVPLLQESGSELIGFSGCYMNGDTRPDRSRDSFRKPELKDPVSGEDLLAGMIKSGGYSPAVSMYIYRRSFLQNIHRSFQTDLMPEDEFYTLRTLCMADRALSVAGEYYLQRGKEMHPSSALREMPDLKEYSCAISQLLSFVTKYPLQQVTREVVLKRTRVLGHHLVKVIQQINREKGTSLSVEDYFTPNELSQLGTGVRYRSKYPGLYKFYSKLKQIVSS